jgi:hypothetical protein
VKDNISVYKVNELNITYIVTSIEESSGIPVVIILSGAHLLFRHMYIPTVERITDRLSKYNTCNYAITDISTTDHNYTMHYTDLKIEDPIRLTYDMNRMYYNTRLEYCAYRLVEYNVDEHDLFISHINISFNDTVVTLMVSEDIILYHVISGDISHNEVNKLIR